MEDYSIWIVSPQGYLHSRCYEEVALGLHHGFAELGINAPVIRERAEIVGRPVILGAILLPMLGHVDIPSHAVIFNLEQIDHSVPWMTSGYWDLLARHEVWDYSETNLEKLRRLGITQAKLCEIGYVPALTRTPSAVQDIDVLMYGSFNDRRLQVVREIRDRGINIECLFGIYGEERDAFIDRAKIILNVHFYEARVFEIVRVSYLLANRKFIVSETGVDQGIEHRYSDGIVFVAYDRLCDACERYLKDDSERQRIASLGFDRFSQYPQAAFLRQVLDMYAK